MFVALKIEKKKFFAGMTFPLHNSPAHLHVVVLIKYIYVLVCIRVRSIVVDIFVQCVWANIPFTQSIGRKLNHYDLILTLF